MLVMDCLMRPIALNTLGLLDATNICCVSPLPIVLILWDTQVHISTMYYSNEIPHVETLIDDSFSSRTVLSIPDIDPDDDHVRFQ